MLKVLKGKEIHRNIFFSNYFFFFLLLSFKPSERIFDRRIHFSFKKKDWGKNKYTYFPGSKNKYELKLHLIDKLLSIISNFVNFKEM